MKYANLLRMFYNDFTNDFNVNYSFISALEIRNKPF